MCLAVPGRIVRWIERQPPFTTAAVDFGGVCRDVNLACTPDAAIGDYVLVHAGIAITRIDADEASRVLATLNDLSLADEAADEDDGALP